MWRRTSVHQAHGQAAWWYCLPFDNFPGGRSPFRRGTLRQHQHNHWCATRLEKRGNFFRAGERSESRRVWTELRRQQSVLSQLRKDQPRRRGGHAPPVRRAWWGNHSIDNDDASDHCDECGLRDVCPRRAATSDDGCRCGTRCGTDLGRRVVLGRMLFEMRRVLVAGDCNAPNALTLPFRLSLAAC